MTRHLGPDELIDLLDGHSPDAAVAHLAACESCRAQLRELREAWSDVSAVEIPEPSPLFWDHLSARVRAAVAEDGQARRFWWATNASWRLVSLAAAAATIALLVFASMGPHNAPLTPQQAAVTAGTAVDTPRSVETFPAYPPPENDEPLALMVDLASDLDWDAAEAGAFTARGGVDRLVADMTDGERAELQRVLEDALESGA